LARGTDANILLFDIFCAGELIVEIALMKYCDLIRIFCIIIAIQFDVISKNEHMEEAKKLYATRTEKSKIRHPDGVMNFGFSKKICNFHDR
jgi:hypothetical protein